MARIIFTIALVFTILLFSVSVFAFSSAVLIDKFHVQKLEEPVNNAIDSVIYSPGESRIKKESIQVYENAVVIEVYNAKVNDINIKDPLVNKDSNMIQIVPESPAMLKEGDIITYNKDNKIKTGRIEVANQDAEGYYYLIQNEQDKIRFIQIKSIVIGILY
ncbi:hypothetical protein J4405_04120 [Candidatus Woesearchaeota archaeon]|nr:hypothetical protein [Candidatus Woesearchaeota archaeon]